MTYTVPRFDPYIYLFARQKNNEEGKRDLSSWRRKISFMCKCGGEKKENNNEEISLEEMKQQNREGKRDKIWMRIFLAEEKKK